MPEDIISENMPTGQPVEFRDEGSSAIINPSVPLPGSHTGKRILALDLGLGKDAWLTSAFTAGKDFSDAFGVTVTKDGILQTDPITFPAAIAGRSPALGKSPQLSSVWKTVQPMVLAAASRVGQEAGETTGGDTIEQMAPELKQGIQTALARHRIPIVTATWAGRPTIVEMDPSQKAQPQLLLVEVYGISSFLGAYGVGRTVKTLTLLPGEETKITMKTWRSSEQTIKEASSIVDSHQEEAAEKFGTQVQNETTDKSIRNSKENWHVEAEAKCSWGFGSAKVSGGAGGEYQSGREEFAKAVNNTTSEHAATASAKRELSITSSAEVTEKTGAEEVTERTIKNVNLRRVLNFVFRELNQEYKVKIHLKDVRLAFTNGRPDSYREVPLSGMRALLDEVLKPNRVDTVAAHILKAVSVAFDNKDAPQFVLEKATMALDGQSWRIEPAVMSGGAFPIPSSNGEFFYRFRRGPLGQDGAKIQVDGVVMKENTVIMRTDSVVVDALLGDNDALDAYAMEVQAAAAAQKTLANRREESIQATLGSITDPVERARIMVEIFAPPPVLAPVPVVASKPVKTS